MKNIDRVRANVALLNSKIYSDNPEAKLAAFMAIFHPNRDIKTLKKKKK